MKYPKPRFTKFNAIQKNRLKIAGNKKKIPFKIMYGTSFAIRSLEGGFLLPEHLLASRRILRKKSRKFLKVWTRIFPNFQRSKKPSQVRMGRGKGKIFTYVARIKPGMILFECSFAAATPYSWKIQYDLIRSVIHKLPLKTKIHAFPQ